MFRQSTIAGLSSLRADLPVLSRCHWGGSSLAGVPPLWVSQTNRGVPPFGHTKQLRVFVDPDLLQYDEVWAAAGTWNDVFGAAPADIVRVAGGVVTDLKRA